MRLKFYVTQLVGLLLFLCVSNRAFSQVQRQALEQISKLLNEKQSRTPVERKISSQLLQAIRENKGQQMAEGVNLTQANVHANAAGMVEVDINAAVSDALLARIKAAGGTVTFSSQKFHSVRAKVSFATAKAIAAYPEVKFIKPAAQSHTVGGINSRLLNAKEGIGSPSSRYSMGLQRPSFKERAAKIRQQLEQYMMVLGTGSVNSQGDHTLGADSTRAKYGYEGQGIRIGVLSDSYNATGTAAADVASGDLPGPGNPDGDTTAVTVLQDITGSTDEGRAMLQIVHDIAPKARLYFATADAGGDAGFASNILALRAAPNNCDIIIDDVIYYDEPAFQDGTVAQAVNEVTAGGALYFSSAGNGGSLLKNESCVWEGDFNGTGSPQITQGAKTGQFHNFGTSSAPVLGDSIVTASSVYILTWADPLGSSSNDYDLFILDKTGTNVKASSTDIQDGTGDPLEGFQYSNAVAGDQLVVFKTSTAAVRAFSLNTNLDGQGKGLKYGTTGQTHGHSSAVAAFSVAASDASAAYPGLFTSSSQVEYFSADGPRRMFFNADSTPVTPGNFLFATNGGTVRNKPDITAADGVSTTMSGFNPFYGTSAAAPHAGAIAALLKSAKPSLTAAQIRNYLTSTALDIQASGYDYNSGYGIVQPLQAMKQINPKPLPVITIGKISATEGAYSNKNGFIEAGETGNITVELSNASLAKAYNVRAVVTTNTPGVTLTQGSYSYGSIATGGDLINTANPFVFAINSSVVCGSAVNFTLTVSFDSGGISPIIYKFSGTVGSVYLASNLGATPAAGSGYTAVSGQQTGRLSRGAVAASCASPLPTDSLITAIGQRQYDAYTFTNTSNVDQCISVTLTSPNGLNIYTASYSSAGFVPSNPATNFVADPGQSATTMHYSFTAPAGKQYTIVVHDVVAGPASGSVYNLSVSNSNCAAAPACAPVKITTTTLATGATGLYYTQIISATGGDGTGDYQLSVTGGLPAGIAVNADSLYGKPTQAGTFPLVIKASAPTGCSSASQNDTLVITGVLPASVTALSGTPQTGIAGQVFTNSLKAKVFDASNKALGGVNVVFIAPGTSASGTFAGADTAIAVSDSTGVATAPPFKANEVQGTYTVGAYVNGVADTAKFQLSNTCISTVVTTNADAGVGSLRYVVENACPAATVTFAPGISKISLTSGEIYINQGITINGTGADALTVSGSNNSRIFNINAGSASVAIAGLTVRDGLPQDTSTNGGGGILMYSGKVSIKKCVFINNDASRTSYGEGGGIDNEGATLTIDQSSIVKNTAYYDGGGLALEYGTTAITNSTISGNIIDTAGSTAGGGIYCNQVISLTNCTVYGNSGQYGGNIYSYNNASNTGPGVVTLKNTIVAGGALIGTGGYGADLAGYGFVSADYNLIQNTSGFSMSGTTTNTISGVSPNLLALANYGGTTATLLPKPNSPVINKGDFALTASQVDQRGYARAVGGRADIGAVEANYATAAQAGTPQSAAISTAFATALQASVTENGIPVNGVSVTFKAPVSTTTASGRFPGNTSSTTAITNASGIATAATFKANAFIGTYTVIDSIGSTFARSSFALTNVKTLAVNFGTITAKVANCAVQIAWQTLTGEAGVTFTLEYSTDGINFAPLYTTPGKGNSVALQTYNYTHTTPAVGANYYRVKETDLNSSPIYSETIIAINTCSNAPVIAYPNPVHNNLTLILPGIAKQGISIFDATGRLVKRYAAATGTLNVDVSAWAGGIYTVLVVKEDKTTFELKIIKN